MKVSVLMHFALLFNAMHNIYFLCNFWIKTRRFFLPFLTVFSFTLLNHFFFFFLEYLTLKRFIYYIIFKILQKSMPSNRVTASSCFFHKTIHYHVYSHFSHNILSVP